MSQTYSKFGASKLKRAIDQYWAATPYGKYLVTWIEQISSAHRAPWIVRSNMINGYPPTPEVLAVYNTQLSAKDLRWRT